MSTHRYFWIFAALSAILLIAPLRTGDLAGYDDATYAHIAKEVARTGDWLNIRSNGYPALEHPPLLVWMEAALFSAFGLSDGLARLPSALSGLGTILLVYALGRKLTGDAFAALLAMFVMATSLYFLKYSARAMTDVPFTFFFLCAVFTWTLGEDDPRWSLAAGAFTALAQMTRGMMGLALPAVLVLHLVISRRRLPLRYAIPALGIAFLPLFAWYAHLISTHGRWFFMVHSTWLENEVYGPLSPAWRRFTGPLEYAWMLAKSYWPWLPFLIAGLVAVIRSRDRRLWLLVVWTAVVFAMCSVARSRVLRYMLPAYPAFAVLSALGLVRLVPARYLRNGLRAATPVLAAVVVAIALFPPTHWHAAEIRPIALAATAATPANDRVVFYDAGQPRFDETNQLQWYGDRNLVALLDHEKLMEALRTPGPRVVVVDRNTYRADIASQIPNHVLAESGHLVCVRLCSAAASCASQAISPPARADALQ